MKVLQINTVYPTGSTGKIAYALQRLCAQQNIECRVACRFYEGDQMHQEAIAVSSWLDCHVHNRLAAVTSLQGCFSYYKTRAFLKKVEKFGPDVIHLHNIHGSYIHHGLLFEYIKKNQIPTVWTLHDCWAFTGGCPHFVAYHCDKWQTGCGKCPHLKQNKRLITDFSHYMWGKKKQWFTGVSNMVLVTPSQWLSQLVESSFLKDHPNLIIRNGIDLSVFKPTPSNFRAKYAIDEQTHILLGVAFGWSEKKGLDVFIELAKRLDRQRYQIVLVGTDEATDKLLPENIISIHRTYDQRELAQIYSAADLLVNPTREEMLGLVNLEANACGTPVVTFRTGGSPECIDENSGSVVKYNDTDALEAEIIRICTQRPYSRQACIENAARFEKEACFSRYIQLYKELADAKKM